MYRKLFKIAVTAITILTANLLTNYISNLFTDYKSHFKPLQFTLIGMGVVLIIFYPLFTRLEFWLNSISAKFIRSSKSLGGKYVGLFISFFICLVILFYFYARLWYSLDIFDIIIQGKVLNYF